MRKTLTIILIFSLNFGFAQSEKDDYEIYSVVLTDRLENWFENHFKKIVLINQYENRFERDIDGITEYTPDSLADYQVNMVYIYSSPETFAPKFIENTTLRKLLADLESDFDNHPKIKTELLDIGQIEIDTISTEKYYRHFGKKFKRIEKGWKKIEKKFGTNMIIELSKIKYQDNYATFYYGHHCGGLCGAGRLIMMEKTDGKWKILGEFRLWDS